MIALHVWDAQGIYSHSAEVDPLGALPERSTPQGLPELEGQQVARWNGSGWEVLPERPALQIPAVDWPALIAARRYDAETGGTMVAGMTLDTGRDSQALITGAAVSAMLDPGYSVRWKTGAGFVDLTAEQIIGVASAVRAHVQAAFDREADLLAALEDGTFTPEMLEEGWPNEPVPESAPS